jgi:hypothetical protein
MAEPTSSAVATLVTTGAVVPLLTAFGVPLGLRADVLLAGLLGALAAIVLLNTVPPTGDTLKELLRTTIRRVSVAVASAVTAGYLLPAVVSDNASVSAILFGAFVAGAGAQKLLAMAVEKLSQKQGGQP